MCCSDQDILRYASKKVLTPSSQLQHDQCAVARCAELVSGKWTLLIVRDLANGSKSWSDLELSLVGISPRTLCSRLSQLVAAGMVTRTRIKGLPPRTMYALSTQGQTLLPIVDAMRLAGEALLNEDSSFVS